MNIIELGTPIAENYFKRIQSLKNVFINKDEILNKSESFLDLNEQEFEDLVNKGETEIYTLQDLKQYVSDVCDSKDEKLIEKAKKDINKLQKVTKTVMRGGKSVNMTYYVKPKEAEVQKQKKGEEQQGDKSGKKPEMTQQTVNGMFIQAIKNGISKQGLQEAEHHYSELSHINKIRFEREWEKTMGEKYKKETVYGGETKDSDVSKDKPKKRESNKMDSKEKKRINNNINNMSLAHLYREDNNLYRDKVEQSERHKIYVDHIKNMSNEDFNEMITKKHISRLKRSMMSRLDNTKEQSEKVDKDINDMITYAKKIRGETKDRKEEQKTPQKKQKRNVKDMDVKVDNEGNVTYHKRDSSLKKEEKHPLALNPKELEIKKDTKTLKREVKSYNEAKNNSYKKTYNEVAKLIGATSDSPNSGILNGEFNFINHLLNQDDSKNFKEELRDNKDYSKKFEHVLKNYDSYRTKVKQILKENEVGVPKELNKLYDKYGIDNSFLLEEKLQSLTEVKDYEKQFKSVKGIQKHKTSDYLKDLGINEKQHSVFSDFLGAKVKEINTEGDINEEKYGQLLSSLKNYAINHGTSDIDDYKITKFVTNTGQKFMVVDAGRASSILTPDSKINGDIKKSESTKELITEHKRLVKVLDSDSHKDDKKEAKKQKKELKQLQKQEEVQKAFDILGI